MKNILLSLLIFSGLFVSGCQVVQPPASQKLTVLAIEPFLADITANVAGDRVEVQSLIPSGVDPHSFELTPQDVAKLEKADVLVLNGGGLEQFLEPVLSQKTATQLVIIASKGLTSRPVNSSDALAENGDPHYWLNPVNVKQYVENIRVGLTFIDPNGAVAYAENARKYNQKLDELDSWIAQEVRQVPPERRLLVTNHESFGYYADQYGFTVVGAVLSSVSSGSSPSAREMSALIEQIKQAGAPAIFLEMDANPELADQIAAESNAKVITNLYTHSLSPADGPAATYLDMMRYNTTLIVEALR